MRLLSLKSIMSGSLLLATSLASHAAVEKYTIDTQGAHAFVEFRVNHLGYSWLNGRFNTFNGAFQLDPETHKNAKVNIAIDTASVDTNHAERDNHLRSKDFLNVKKFPTAQFVSTSTNLNTAGNGTITGELTLNGVTKSVTLNVNQVGFGLDPWGGYRRGYEATTEFKMADFDMAYDLGPASRTVEMTLSIEGVRQ